MTLVVSGAPEGTTQSMVGLVGDVDLELVLHEIRIYLNSNNQFTLQIVFFFL